MPLGAPSPPVLGAEAAPRGLWRPVVVGWFLAPPCVSSVPWAPAVRNGDNDAYPTGLLSRSGQIHSSIHPAFSTGGEPLLEQALGVPQRMKQGSPLQELTS